MIDVKDAVVLNTRFVADANGIHIATNGNIEPNARSLADYNVAHNLSALVDIGGAGDLRVFSSKWANHETG
jgi:hypothetical protein